MHKSAVPLAACLGKACVTALPTAKIHVDTSCKFLGLEYAKLRIVHVVQPQFAAASHKCRYATKFRADSLKDYHAGLVQNIQSY